MSRKVKINYPKIIETALKGIRRTAIFMGLGLNAAYNPEFKNYSLTDIALIQLIPDKVDEKTIANFKENFAIWIVSCGFRELIETFSAFLDQIFDASLHIAVSTQSVNPEKAKGLYRSFTFKGIRDKLKDLEKHFGIKSSYSDHLNSIQQARNCLTHRQGRVERIDLDCSNGAALTIKWKGIDCIASTKSEETKKINVSLEEPLYFREEGFIGIKFVENKSSFKLGTIIKIPPKDLAEICFFILIVSKEIVKYAQDYAIHQKAIKPEIFDNNNV